MAVWSTRYINDLPDSAFLYIEPGGKKDDTDKTVPRALRHFPYKDKNGNIDIPHLINAIQRIPQSKVGLTEKQKQSLQDKARRLLEAERKSVKKLHIYGGNNMIPNDEFVQKAVIDSSVLDPGGALNPEQYDQFVDYIKEESVILASGGARLVRVTGASRQIDKLDLGKRAIVLAEDARDPRVRRSVTTSKVLVTPREFMVAAEISDGFVEECIENGSNVREKIVQKFAIKAGNDMEEMFVHGDTNGVLIQQSDYVDEGETGKYVLDRVHSVTDGWFKNVPANNVADLSTKNIGQSVFYEILRKLPSKFKKSKRDLRWYLSEDLLTRYYEKLSTRIGDIGEKAIIDGVEYNRPIAGIIPIAVPLMEEFMPITEEVTLTGTTAEQLQYRPLSETKGTVVVDATVDQIPLTPYTEGSSDDYTVDYVNGTIVRTGSSTIPSGGTVKVKYYAYPQILLTHKDNLIVGISRDVRIESDRDIYGRVTQYAITMKAINAVEETTALAKGVNIGVGV